jgi:segregation and condensation protein A
MSELEDPVEMLVEMAKKGEIDPWNVDVIDVAGKFLEKLEKAQKLDLRVSGRVLLYAAILIRMKAEILSEEALKVRKREQEIIPDEIDFEEFFDYGFDESNLDYDLHEQGYEETLRIQTGDEVIDGLLAVRRKTVRRFTTLKDLIKELQMAESIEKRRKRRKQLEKEEAIKKTLETPHEENIEELLIKVENELLKLFRRKPSLYFSEVIQGKEREKLNYYLSILHLAYRKMLELKQERIFEEDIELKLLKLLNEGHK